MRTREIPNSAKDTLKRGLEREKMVKYVATTLKLMGDIPTMTLVHMLAEKYPQHVSWNLSLIVSDGRHIANKM